MDIGSINFSQFLDMAFVLLVAGVSVKGLFARAIDHEAGSRVWREELIALEQSIRELITEASEASSSFDKNLLQRKEEIEQLLDRTERNLKIGAEQTEGDKSIANNRRTQSSRIDVGYPDSPEREFVMGDSAEQEILSLIAAADSTADSVSKNGRTQIQRAGQKNTQPTKEKSKVQPRRLASFIEKIGTPADETYKQLSMIDQVTYKIARRLLSEGKEIHIVARKLELPVSEIRLLDRLMRQESKSELGIEAKREEASEVNKSVIPAELDFEPLLPNLNRAGNEQNSTESAVI